MPKKETMVNEVESKKASLKEIMLSELLMNDWDGLNNYIYQTFRSNPESEKTKAIYSY